MGGRVTLTPELDRYLSELRAQGKRLTRFDSLAKSHGMTEDEAKAVLNAFRQKYGERVRGGVEEVKEEAPKPKKWYQVIGELGDWAVDSGTVWGGVIIGLFLCALSLWIMGPSTLEKIGFVAMAFILVLFGFRALVKGNVPLWVMCESIVAFLAVSFVLVGLDYQTNLTADDRQLTALETAETTAGDYLTALQELQKTKGEGYKSQVETQQATFNEASEKAGAYRILVANKPKHAPEIKAYDILLAIPKAVMGSEAKLTNDLAMHIALGLFSMVFVVLPITLYTIVRPRRKE
jgi:hypothetical protein